MENGEAEEENGEAEEEKKKRGKKTSSRDSLLEPEDIGSVRPV